MLPLKDRTLHVIFGVTLIGVIGVSILSPAFPKISMELGVSKAEVAMLVTTFTFPGIFFAPFMGVLADRIGRRKIIVPSLFLFAIAGMACAFVDFKTMLILRFLQGIGGAALIALSATIIGDLYAGLDRARVLGYNASVLAIGTASYPFIGGILAYFDWRLPFLAFALAIPVGIGAMFVSYPEVKPTLSFEAYVRKTMAILKDRRLIFEFVSGAAVFIILYGAFLTYFSFLLREKFSSNEIYIGIILASMPIFMAVFASRLEFFIRRFGAVRTIKFGFACYAASMFITPFIPSPPLFIFVTFLFGIGHGTVLPTLQNLIVSTAPMENRAIVMAAYGSLIRIGQTTGPIVAALSALHSLSMVFLVSALIALAFSIAYNFFKV